MVQEVGIIESEYDYEDDFYAFNFDNDDLQEVEWNSEDEQFILPIAPAGSSAGVIGGIRAKRLMVGAIQQRHMITLKKYEHLVSIDSGSDEHCLPECFDKYNIGKVLQTQAHELKAVEGTSMWTGSIRKIDYEWFGDESKAGSNLNGTSTMVVTNSRKIVEVEEKWFHDSSRRRERQEE